MEGIHIALAPEILTYVGGIPITNTLITSLIVMALLVFIAFRAGKKAKLVPGRVQVFFEMIIEFILDYVEKTLEGRENAIKYFPLLATLFLFIFLSNLLEFVPGIGSVGFFETVAGEEGFIPLFRSVNTDLNITLALTLIVFSVIEVSGVRANGFFSYLGRFFNFKSIMGFFIGFIEFFSEIARLISFSFRLYGNIFAGEVMIMVIIFFFPVIVPVPFMLFEVFVGFMQAAIFALLTLFFIKIAITKSH